jgi:type II secretion system protein G
MMCKLVDRKSKGFTLIEMLIVIVVIAILALIVIPRLLSAGRRAKESALRGDLQQLRNAIQHFEADCGAWPPALTDLMVANGAAISAAADGNGITVDDSGYKGPYLRTGHGNLPNDPFTGAADWVYDNALGDVHSNSALVALDGTAYNTW